MTVPAYRNIVRRSNLVRKSISGINRIPRALLRTRVTEAHFRERPILLGNSIPKSGTHLLLQILDAFPHAKNFGTFIARAPSISFVARSDADLGRLISRALPGEIIGAHLTYTKLIADAIASVNACHYFIYRDPRDVVVSNAHYMQQMNVWNRLHRTAARWWPSLDEKMMALIVGAEKEQIGFEYGNLRQRLEEFVPWIGNPSVCAIRFEELMSERRAEVVSRMARYLQQRSSGNINEDDAVVGAMAKIDPTRSHTFRSGQIGEWRAFFTERHKKAMKDIAGDLLVELGYERDKDW